MSLLCQPTPPEEREVEEEEDCKRENIKYKGILVFI